MAKMHVQQFKDIENALEHYLALADRTAEERRERFITTFSGQSMTYEAKYQEAKRYPQGNRWPFLEAEATATGSTVSEVAASVLEARTKWEEIGAEIEGSRLKAKKAIRSATTSAAMYSAVQDLKAELASL